MLSLRILLQVSHPGRQETVSGEGCPLCFMDLLRSHMAEGTVAAPSSLELHSGDPLPKRPFLQDDYTGLQHRNGVGREVGSGREEQQDLDLGPPVVQMQILRLTGGGGESLHQSPSTSLSTECPDQPSPLQWKAAVGGDREEAASTVKLFQKYHFQHSYPQCWYFCLLSVHAPPRSLG